MARSAVHLPVVGLGNTLRKDTWWLEPLATFTVLSSFIVYATFRAFENNFYEVGGYLSPFYSPHLFSGHIFGFVTPAMLILPGPAGFRLTCYYYRKAYYRSFGMDPPACAVGERRKHDYRGETALFVFQNLHRYAMYIAVLFLAFLWTDVVRSVFVEGHFQLGVGTLVMATNTTLLSLYTFSCHSLRHLVGGNVNSFSTEPLGNLRHTLWRGVSSLNTRHMLWAWLSLFAVALTDFYIRSVASGAVHDFRII